MSQQIEYMPYGETWIDEGTDLNVIGYKFTGKELDTETGLYYYGARYLDPQSSRWLSPDPVLPQYLPEMPVNDDTKERNKKLPGKGGVFNPVNMQVYHYAANNPVKYVDPTGESTYINETGNVLLVDVQDYDMGIYLCQNGAINKYYKVGETWFLDSFMEPDSPGNPNKQRGALGTIHLNNSIDAKIYSMYRKSKYYGKEVSGFLLRNNGRFDIKTQCPGSGAYDGFLLFGRYVTLRDAGNILAGMIAGRYGTSKEDRENFQKLAGALEQGGVNAIRRCWMSNYTEYFGEAPLYGEKDIQYTRSSFGFDIIQQGWVEK